MYTGGGGRSGESQQENAPTYPEIKTPSPPSFKLKNKDKEPTADPAHSCVVQYSDKETATVELVSV